MAKKTVYKAKYSGKVYNTAREAAIDNRNYLTAKRLSEQTRKISVAHIGGNSDEARAEFWRQEPVMQHAVDSIANRYGISSESLKYRLDKEGFTDKRIRERNDALSTKLLDGSYAIPARGYRLLGYPGDSGISIGLDDARSYITSGRVKLINEQWLDTEPFKNEKGRITYPVNGLTHKDNIGIVAAHLKYFKDKAKQHFPNASDYDLERYSNAYFNRGEAGGRRWVNSGAKGYNYKRSLEDINR